MKIRLAMMAAFSVLLLAGALLWLLDHRVTQERKAALEAKLRDSVTSLNQSVQSEVKGLRRTLSHFSNLNRERVEWNAFQPFFALAQLRFREGPPVVTQFAANPGGRARDWRAEDLQKMLAGLRRNPATPQSFSLRAIAIDPQRPMLALFWQEGDRNWLALTGPEFLQAFLDLQKDGESTFAVMNTSGEILAHTTAEYIGTRISDPSIYSETLSSPEHRAYRRTIRGVDGRPAWVASERVPRSDLVTMSFQPAAIVQNARAETFLFGLLAALGLMIVSVSGIWWMGARAERALQLAHASYAQGPAPVAQPLKKKTEAKVSSKTIPDTQDVPLRLASALGHELKSPLVSILGYCQMILTSTNDERIKEPTESILREARSCRNVLDKLLAFAGEKETPQKSAKVEALILKVLREDNEKFKRKHVKIIQDFTPTSAVPLAEEDFEKVLRHLFDNAVEAMDRMAKKELTIRVGEDSNSVFVEIQDCGEGIEESKIQQVMHPFFTTRNSAQHLGLGLPAASGIVREHGGELKIQSKRGSGTTVRITLPRVQQKKQASMEPPAPVRDVANFTPPGSNARPGEKQLVAPAVEPLVLLDQTAVREMAANGEEVTEHTKSSPPDLDLDQLFSMPEPTVVRPAPKEEAVKAKPTAEDKTMVMPSDASPNMVNEKVNLPNFKAPERKSVLDQVKVAIRRPGTRLE